MAKRAMLAAKSTEAKKELSISRTQKTDRSQCMKSADRVLSLQRAIGNQAVGRLIKSGALQAKLRIGQTGDKYEQEADRVADAVMRMPQAVSGTPGIQRACPKCEEGELKRQPIKEEDEEEKLQRQPVEEEGEEELLAKAISGSISEVNPDLESHIQSLKGGGQSLSENDRTFFEPRFGQDFSQVRLHTDTRAAETAREVNARAFTIGSDVVFGVGQYSPETREGLRLMAHELTHVVQKGRAETTKLGNNQISRQQAQPPQVVQIVINRQNETNQATMGDLTVGTHNLRTLELPDRNNAATNNSQTAGRIPAGTYQAHVRTDGERGWRLELDNVPGRTNIQIHVAYI